MIRKAECTGKTVEAAVEAACQQLGVSVQDAGVTVEVLEQPVHKLFKSIPAKVLVSYAEPEAPVAEPAPVEPAPAVEEVPVEEPAAVEEAEEIEEIEEAVEEAKDDADEVEVPINLDENEKARAAAEYLKEITTLMGAQDVTITAVQKGEATILKLEGNHVSVLIGRRGETMESLSYLASLVANHLGGDYMKLGLDVSGYRGKREKDLTVLAQRLGERVRRNNRAYEMEPMNPYERRLIHSAIGQMEGLRSESKGEGNDRHVVIYSTAEGADNEHPEKERRSGGNGRGGNRGGSRSGKGNDRRSGNRGERSDRGERSGSGRNGGRGGNRGERGERRNGGNRGGFRGGSSVPERNFHAVDADKAAPVAPKRTERVDDFADFSFGKIEF